MICDSKKCEQKVNQGNENLMSAINVAIIASNYIPVAGPGVALFATILKEAGEKVHEAHSAHDKEERINRSIATGGVVAEYNEELAKVLEELADESDPGKVMVEIAKMAVAEYVTHESLHKVGHGIAHKLEHSMHKTLSDKAKVTINIAVHKAYAIAKTRNKNNNQKMSEEDFKQVLEDMIDIRNQAKK
jgi:hypothetical protein